MSKVVIYPFRKYFPELFRKEKKRLSKILGACKIEHFGSTAIVIEGKGIIDIIIGFKNTSEVKKATKLLSSNGYFLADDKPGKNARIFLSNRKKESKLGDFHVHLVLEKSKEFKDAILFRDYLKKHSTAARRYSFFKRKIANMVDRPLYTKMKASFITKVIRSAQTP